MHHHPIRLKFAKCPSKPTSVPDRNLAPSHQRLRAEPCLPSPSSHLPCVCGVNVTMSGIRSDRYESKSDVDGIEELSKKLTVDLRKHIRALVRSLHRLLCRNHHPCLGVVHGCCRAVVVWLRTGVPLRVLRRGVS